MLSNGRSDSCTTVHEPRAFRTRTVGPPRSVRRVAGRITGPVSLRLGFAGDGFGYAIDLGLPIPSTSAFSLDPEIKRECIFAAPVYRPNSVLVDRRNAVARIKDDSREWSTLTTSLQSFDSMLSEVSDAKIGRASCRERV